MTMLICIKIHEKSHFPFPVIFPFNLYIFTRILKFSHLLYFPFFIYSGINAEITYTIQTDNNKNSSEFFHIDEDEGTIYLKKSLDHETQQHHRFTIKVIDKGSPALSSSK